MAEQPTPTQLVEELRAEQRSRWQKGEFVSAETYLRDHPSLQADPNCALKLVYQEVLLREARGDSPQLEEYLGRFPQYEAQLKPLFAVHRAIESSHWLDSYLADTPLRRLKGEEIGTAGIPNVPGYQILGKLGQGGMGVVYKTRHERLNREVALKMILAGAHASTEELARFRAEAEAQARLHHPNIVQIYEVGDAEGCPYFALEYVDGESLHDKLRAGPLPARTAAQLIETLARAVQHAHQRGLVHRDLKPANVLLAADGTPKITDFGLAKQLKAEGYLSQSGAIVGTPSYMAPEQTAVGPTAVGPLVDVYALGVILYEMLTGRPPFLAETMLDTLLQVRSLDPVPPRRLQPKVPRDLETICLKCLQKDPAKRYVSAEALAEDLRRFQAGEPIRARPVGSTERVWRWCRRKPATAALLTGAATLLVAVVALSLVIAVNREQARQQAEADKLEIAKQKDIAEEHAKAAQAREAESRAVLDFVDRRVFAAARPEGQQGGLGAEVTLRRALEAAVPFVAKSFANQPVVEARLRLTLGNSFWYLGDAKTAAEQDEAACVLYARHRGLDHADTLRSMGSLANCYFSLGRHAEALKLYEETLALQKAKLGLDHKGTLTSMNNVAACYDALGRHAEALQLRLETLALRKVKQGPDHPDTLHSMHALAESYVALGRYTESLNLGEETLVLRKAKLGPDHPDTLATMHNLTYSYTACGRHTEAVKLCEETLALLKSKLGPDHAITLSSMAHLANCYEGLGRHSDALTLREETLALMRAKLPPGHRYTFKSMQNLANSYHALGRHADALRLHEETLALRRAKLGPDHADTLTSMHNLANSYEALGRHADALKLREETVALRKDKLGLDHPETLLTMWGLAESLMTLERGAEAVLVIDECIQRARGKVVDPGLLPGITALRLRHFEKAKDTAGCRQTAEMWEKLNRADAAGLYTAAGMRAVNAAVLRATPGADTTRLAKEEADRAMAWLKQAVAAGYKDVAHMKKDKDLDPLRSRDDFKKLLADLEESTPLSK